ncbi:Protein of uncharacterised function (DUF2570) [Serratia liquefaciens]|uniref:hypothetical protein n=1 Tax=Serratia liquefaciens TaxID=614 RepID=UPI0021785DE0|nr:hypothetical protein [Serratia liquefaciens]CAI1699292.1 Protein of uncharacterised function (DUF2570) [Serratia liquefaciens]HDS8357457.1 DUF2570 family protein [Serratia liquefaciens]
MSGWLTKLAGSGLLIMLVVSIFLGGYSSLLSHRLELTRQQNAEQNKTLTQQTALISTLRADDARNRAMMAEQRQREQQLRQQGEIYQRKYQDAIKKNKCAAERMPDAVLELLRGTDTNTASSNRSVTP